MVPNAAGKNVGGGPIEQLGGYQELGRRCRK
jgi:hypothetical protein